MATKQMANNFVLFAEYDSYFLKYLEFTFTLLFSKYYTKGGQKKF